MIQYLFTAIGFPSGGIRPYCTQKAMNSNICTEKQYNKNKMDSNNLNQLKHNKE